MALHKLAAPVAVSTLLALPSTALAQAGGWQIADVPAARTRYAEAPPVSYYDLRRMAYDEGYREGVKEGEKDARRGDRFDYRDEREFQRADRGYHRSYGDREGYRRLFREGYAAGYSAAYSRHARGGGSDGWYGRPGTYGQRGGYGGWGGYPRGSYYGPAFDNGSRDGFEKGLEDARKHRGYDPRRHSWYRSGDRHYEGRYGPREQYKDVYREGFLRGYQRGYEDGRHHRW